MLLLSSLVLEWPEENYRVKWAEGRGQCSRHSGSPQGPCERTSLALGGQDASAWSLLASFLPAVQVFVVAYVLLDTVKKLSGNGFILWSEQYFVIYDSVNGRKSIKCIKFSVYHLGRHERNWCWGLEGKNIHNTAPTWILGNKMSIIAKAQ